MKIRLSTYILTENLKNISNIFRIIVTILLVIVRLTLKEQHGGKQYLLLIKCNIKSVCVVSDWWIYNCALLHKEHLLELKDASIEMCVIVRSNLKCMERLCNASHDRVRAEEGSGELHFSCRSLETSLIKTSTSVFF